MNTEYPPHVLRQYALIADGERGAIIGPRGDISWMCAPKWHDGAVFADLLGGNGQFAVTPVDRFVWGGYYEDGTLIWRSRWITNDGPIECREALAFPGDEHRAVVLRRILAHDHDAKVAVILDPRADYGRANAKDLQRRDGIWTAKVGDLHVRFRGLPDAKDDDGVLHQELVVPHGRHHDLVLEISDRPFQEEPVDPNHAWRATESTWQDVVPRFENCLYPSSTKHSYAILRGLTSRSGGMVAAATTSLPERAGTGRSYDYRYVWIRDQCITGQAIAASGAHPLLDDAVRFVTARLLEDGDKLIPAYLVDGGRVPDQFSLDLPGYPGGSNLIGNHVNDQFQLDAFGESLLLFAAADMHGRLDDEARKAARIAANAIARRWQEADAGMWETVPKLWTESRLMCVAGLKAFARIESANDAALHLTLADQILGETARTCVHPSGRWQRAPDDDRVDASLLLPPLRGALAPDDPRTVATLQAVLRDLSDDGYVYRFRHDDRPLQDAEGSFLFCGFLLALALHQQGRNVDAIGWHERTRAACGPPVIYTEEFDVHQHQLRGNLPQAFVHAAMIQSSAELAQNG